jgi:hypothetical protein
MKLAAVVLVVVGSSVHAEPFRPRLENLHVSVNCADYWADTARGLQVVVDGIPQRPAGENGAPAVEVASDGTSYTTWVTTDVSYSLTPGVHHLAISAPGCSALEQDVDTTSLIPISVSGRLPVADPSLSGPTGAPNGIGVASGLYMGGRGGHGASNDIFSTSYAYDRIATTGGYLTTSIERRGFAFAIDTLVAHGSTTGMVTQGSSFGMPPGTSPFTGSATQVGMALRIGMRQRRGEVAFAEGAGVAGDMWIQSFDGNGPAAPPTSIDGDFYIPLWAQVTYKPGCNWGAQVLASYDVHPGSSNEDIPSVMAGVMFQPTSACSEATGLALR